MRQCPTFWKRRDEVYEDKGWNLATGTNVWLTDAGWQQRHLYPIFPTLTDLYHKVEAVTVGDWATRRVSSRTLSPVSKLGWGRYAWAPRV